MPSFNDNFAFSSTGSDAATTGGLPWGAPSSSPGRALSMDTAFSPFSDASRNSDAWPISPGDSSNDSHHDSSPEADVASTLATPVKSGRTPSRYDWSKYMPIIKKLYIDDDKTLKEVLEIMQREHNFVATPRMVKTRLKKWGYSKNVSVKSEEVESLMEMIFDAESQGDVRRTSTEVTLATGRVVGLDRVAAHLRRKRIPTNIVHKASQLSLARYHQGSPSPTSMIMESPIEFRVAENIFSDVHSYVYTGFQLPDAGKMVQSGPTLEHGEIVDIVSSARNFFTQSKDAEALALLRKAPVRLKELLESGDPTIPRHVFMVLIHLLNAPGPRGLNDTVKALVKYIASLVTGESSHWPQQHPLRRILVHLGQAADGDLLDVAVRGYKCLLLSYESLPRNLVTNSTTPAWLDLGEAAGFDSLPVAYLEKFLQDNYEKSLANPQESQLQPFQQLFYMAELERQKVKARGLSTDRLKELFKMTLGASECVVNASSKNAQMNCHYYLAGIYYKEREPLWAKTHMDATIELGKQLGLDASVARLMAELQGWHREWGDSDKVASIQDDIVEQMNALGLDAREE